MLLLFNFCVFLCWFALFFGDKTFININPCDKTTWTHFCWLKKKICQFCFYAYVFFLVYCLVLFCIRSVYLKTQPIFFFFCKIWWTDTQIISEQTTNTNIDIGWHAYDLGELTSKLNEQFSCVFSFCWVFFCFYFVFTLFFCAHRFNRVSKKL